MRSTILLAAHAADRLRIGGPELAAASSDTRVIEGLALPYGTGDTNLGRITVTAASNLNIPAELARIKLTDAHQDPPVSVGYCTAAKWTPEGLWMSFKVGATPEGDAVLQAALERTVDAMSVEVWNLEVDADGNLISGDLNVVSMVPIPAYADARVTRVAAAQTPPAGSAANGRNTAMTDEQRARLAELLALNTRTPEQEVEYVELVQLAAADSAPPAAPAEPTAPADAAAAAAPAPQLAAAHSGVPAGLPTPGGRSRRPIGELYAAMSRVLTGVSRPGMEAALLDITQGGNIWVAPTGFEGELWSGVQTQRTWVPMLTAGTLNSYKGSGWRWAVRPEVDDYAGDKADVPSNQPTTEAAEWTAARLAGAHNLDRKFWDFGDTEFIASYYEALRESYAMKSDVKARAFILASATVADSTVLAGASILDAALALKLEMEDEDASTGVTVGTPDYYVVNSGDYRDLMGVTASDVPAFLDQLGITPDKLRASAAQAAGTVTAGVKAAGQFKELPGSPIRVETVSLSDGGMDGGVFGYYATLLNNAAGIKKIAIPA